MYKYLDHTSDIGILIKSKSLEKLFEESVFAMFSLTGKMNTGAIYPAPARRGGVHKLPKEYNVNLEDNSYAELLVRFLNEFLYLFYAKSFLPVKVNVLKIGRFFVESKVVFIKVTEKNFTFLREIKAATYHGAAVSGKKSFKAEILFDV